MEVVEVVERADELYPELNSTELRVEFLDEVPQTLDEDTVMANEKVDQEDAFEEEILGQETSSTEALTTEASGPQSHLG